MKIGILVDKITVGGVGKIAIEEVKALHEVGTDVYLVVLKRDMNVRDNWIDSKKVPIVYLDDRLPHFLRFSMKFPMFHFFSIFHIAYPFLLPFVVKRKEFDYLIVHGTFTCFTAIALKWINKISFSSFIWDPVNYIINRVYAKQIPSPVAKFLSTIAKLIDSLIVNQSDMILVGGKAHNSYFKRIDPRVVIKVIPPSIKPVNKLIKKKGNYVLMVTAWKEGKSPEYIFEIIKKLPNLRIKMVGKWLDSAYLRNFVSLVKKNKYDKNIDIVGAVTEEELRDHYKNALVLLQTNDDRGFGMPALEAAGSGTSFIIPKGQGVCEIFRDTIDGFYTTEKDTKEIVSKIEMFYQDKKKAITMGESAWRVAREKCSWKKHAEALIMVSKKNST